MTKTDAQAHSDVMAACTLVVAHSERVSAQAFPPTRGIPEDLKQALVLSGALAGSLMLLFKAFAERERAKGTTEDATARALSAALIVVIADVFNEHGKDPEDALRKFIDQIRATLYANRAAGR